MNDIRRTILWVIFGFSMVLLWDQWQVHNGRQATFFPSAPKPAASAPAAPGSAPASTVPATGAAATAAVPGAAPAAATPALPKERITVTTDVMRVTFDTEGGTIVRTEFLKHAGDSAADKGTSTFVLLEQDAQQTYVAQSGVVGAGVTPNPFPDHTTVMAFKGERELKEGVNELTLRFESPEKGGIKLAKVYTVKRGAYEMPVKYEVTNVGTAPVAPQVYMQIVRGSAGGNQSYFTNPTGTFTGPAVYSEEQKFQKVEFADIDKNKAEFQKEATNGYVAMVQHYFASAWIVPDGVKRENFVRKAGDSLYAAGTLVTLPTIAPGTTQAIAAKFFAGPQEEKLLERTATGLDLVKDYGMFTILAKPLYWLLDKLHSFIGNWGWSIVALVLIIKIAFYWLQAKGYESMAKMKAVNPRIMQIRERYKDNPQQLQQEMMRIYKEEKVNPFGGCLPILVQIPVFIALYWVLLSSVEMRNAPWIGWIRDLSSPDPYFILPVVMTLTTLLQTALNPVPPDPMQAKMMWFMPLIFSVMFFFFPAGLVLYWITNNVLSIAQQWVINTRMGVPPEFNLPKFS
jgi:YidC/Oxa1 family membrane protein insertase